MMSATLTELTRRSATRSICLIAAAAATVACGGDYGSGTPAGPSGPRSVGVSMVSSGGGYTSPLTYAFSPRSLSISAGDTVVWRNGTSAIHTVTADAGGFDSGDLGNNAIFRWVFDEAGTYAYHCRYHAGMTGTITVAP